MTVSSTTTKVSYSGNGSTTVFAYGFKIFADADLRVIERAADGTETVKSLTTHYTVSGAGTDSGGNVTFGTAPASGVTVIIKRNLTLTQGTDYVANDPFPAESHEEALDRLTFIAQGIQEELDRAIKASETNTLTGAEFTISATDRANKVFSFDGSGNLAVTQELGTFKGDWATSTTYAVRDIVKDTSTNNIFIVTEAHTSSGSQPLTTNANSAKYALIVDAAAAATSATAAATSATAAATSATASATAQAASETAKTASETAKTASETAQAAAETSATAAAASASAAASAALAPVSNDTSPELGGDLDVLTHAIVSSSNRNIALTPNGSGVVQIDGSNGISIESGAISIKNSGAQSYVRFYCESSNAHYAQLQAPAHADFGGNLTIVLPATAGTLALTSQLPTSGISNGHVATFGSGVVDNDFLRVNGTTIEGRSASELVSDIGATTATAAADEATALAIALG